MKALRVSKKMCSLQLRHVRMFTQKQLDVTIVRNGTDVAITDRTIKTVVCATLSMSNVVFVADAHVQMSIVFVSDAEIQILNQTYRNKNVPTDVLSFPEDFAHNTAPGVDHKNEENFVKGNVALGDIIMSCATIRRYATIDNVPLDRLLKFVISHGVLHLLGYNHSRMMFTIQDTVTDTIHET